jgi:hypothetical protein
VTWRIITGVVVARLLPLVVGLLSIVQSAQEPPAITARVLTPDGVAVSSGTVALVSSGRNRVTSSIAKDGRFRIVADATDRQSLIISVLGFAPYRANIIVPPSRAMKLPDLTLLQATYYRLRVVTPDREPLSGRVRFLSLDADGLSIPDPLQHTSEHADYDGTITLGPLPIGRTLLAVDRAPFAQMRLRDINVDGSIAIIDGGTIVVAPGGRLHVDIVDASGKPVPRHDVWIEDARQPSPLSFTSVKTNEEGHALFDRLGAGRYVVWTRMADRCGGQMLSIARNISISGSGVSRTRIVIGGQAAFRIVSPVGPLPGRPASVAPETPDTAPWQPRFEDAIMRRISSNKPSCGGFTDSDGRVTMAPFAPGPARLNVTLFNSTYVRVVSIPENGAEIAIQIPDGLIPVKVITAGSRRPLAGAKVIWTGSGGRVEAVTTANGDALLEGVGLNGGTLTIGASDYQTLEGSFAELPDTLQEVVLTPLRANRMRITIETEDHDPLPNAIVELQSSRLGDPVDIAATGSNGVAPFTMLPPGVLQMRVHAEGFIPSTSRVTGENGGGIGVTLKREQ